MLIESFLDYLQYERNYSEKTVLAYGEDIKQLQEFAQEEYGRFNPLEVEAELIREWIVSLMDRGYTSTSVNRKLSSLRSFYKYLLRQGEGTKDPLCKITGPKNKKPLPVFLKVLFRSFNQTEEPSAATNLAFAHTAWSSPVPSTVPQV